MHQPQKWCWGLLALAPLWALVTGIKTAPIEADLLAKARESVARLPADTVEAPQVSVAGRDVTINGQGFNAQSAPTAARTVDAAWGVRLVDVGLDQLPATKPYQFSARTNANQIILEGNAPLQSTRAKLAQAARAAAPGLTVVDGMKSASGAPGAFDTQAAFAIGEAARLVDGAASFADGAYSISGEAKTFEAYDAAMAATRQLPQGLTLAKAEITPPTARPYAWSATRNGAAVTLAGFAPSEAARTAIAARAAQAFPGAQITNLMRVARGAPAGDFAEFTGYGLGELGRLSSGSVSLSDGAYSISGTPPTVDAYIAATGATMRLPQGLTLAKADIQPVEIRPYTWGATRQGNTVTLTGHAPSDTARAAIAQRAAAAMPGAQVTNNMQIASGAPAGDFAALTGYGLGELGKLASGSVNLTDGAYAIAGAAPNPGAYESLIAATKQLPQGLTLAKAEITPAEVKPYTWGATRSATGVTLTGFAPSEETRAAIAQRAAAAFPGAQVTNDMKVARGAPAGDFTAFAAYGLGEAAKLSAGAVSLTDGAYSISGAAPNPAAYDALMAATRQLPQGLTLAKAEIAAAAVRPYTWGATREGNNVTLTGFAPSDAARAAMAQRAASTFPGAQVTNHLQVAAGAPAGDFAAATNFGLAELARLRNGSVGLSDAAYSISGDAPSVEAYDAAIAATRQLPQGFSLARAEIQPAEVKPYAFGAQRDGNTVTLTGFAPSDPVRTAIAQRAATIFPGAQIQNRLQIARGAPTSDFAAAASFGLEALGKLSGGAMTLNDGAFSISGSAPNVSAYDAVMAATKQLPQGLTLAKAEISPAEAKPYAFSATRDANGLTLSGFAPTEAARAAIAQRAASAFPNVQIVNNLQIARGAPQGDFAAMAGYGLAELGKLGNGSVSLTDNALALTGAAPSVAVYDAVLAATKQLPQGMTLAKAEITPAEVKPYTFSATREGNAVTLSGFAPSDAARAAIVQRAGQTFAGARIDNKLQIARGAPQGDWAAMTGYGLGELGKLSGGSVSLSDAAYSISGAAQNSAVYEAALAATKQLPAGMTLAKADIAPPEAKPYAFAAAREGAGIVLTGFAPSEAVKEAIGQRAQQAFPGVRVDNRLQIARGAPQGDFGAAAGFVLTELGKLTDGRASLADARFSISGTGNQGVTNQTLTADARGGLPQGFSVAAIDVREAAVSPYVFNAERIAGRVRLTGYYPDQRAHNDIVAAAKARFGADAIDDQMQQGRGAPNDYMNAVTGGLTNLARLSSGNFALNNTSTTLKGEAPSEQVAAQTRTAFTGSQPSAFRSQHDITFKVAPLPPPEPAPTPVVVPAPPPAPDGPLVGAACQSALNTALLNGKINFETARADIHRESYPLLDVITPVLVRCMAGGTHIEVSGHTDSQGAPQRNKALSERRAKAVVDYLVKKNGIDPAKITGVGYGEERPIASNDTPEGMAQNRRIEMTVK